MLASLRQDDLARDILNRVDTGPFVSKFLCDTEIDVNEVNQGPSGRMTQPVGSTKEDMFAQIFKTNESASNRDIARQRRQSRISREVVSSGWFHETKYIISRSSSSIIRPVTFGRTNFGMAG